MLARTGRATLVVANGGGHAVEAVLVQLGTGLLCLAVWAAAGLALLGVAGLRASRHRPAVIGAAAMAGT